MDQRTHQYLTFTLGEEGFAIEITRVREVLGFTHITKVPRTPDFVRGVINLRGNVVPVIDLRLQLGMSAAVKTVDTCIVIVKVTIGPDTLHMGMLADSVQEVLEIDQAMIEPAPKLGIKLNTDYIKGMAKNDVSFSIVLDIDKVFSGDDLASLAVAQAEAVAA